MSENPSTDNRLDVGGVVRVSRLDDLKRIRAESARLYREARRREGRFPDALTAQRLAQVLGTVRTMVELEAFERRIEALERKADEPK
jgi:hypothetical protein